MPGEEARRGWIGSQRPRPLPALPWPGTFLERKQAFLGQMAPLAVCARVRTSTGGQASVARFTPAT